MVYNEEILVGKKILLISPEFWGINLVSKHHYAIQLSMRNKVYFLNPPSNTNLRQSIDRNLTVIDYKVTIRGINHLPSFLRNLFNKHLIKRIKSISGAKSFDIIWSFDPFRFQNLKILKPSLSIYHAVDIHNSKLEKEIAKTANIVFTSSDLILKRLPEKRYRYNIGHGLAHHFTRMRLMSYSRGNKLRVGYLGNLHYKYLDTDSLTKIINENPDIEFHFIGPYLPSNLSRESFNDDFIALIKSKKNTILHGPIPSKQLPQILVEYDAFILCYTGDENREQLSNPHKILEFLSTGKVVISHYIDEYKKRKDIIEMSNFNIDIPGNFKKVINNLEKYNHPDLQRKRKAFALNCTYDKVIKRIELKLQLLMK